MPTSWSGLRGRYGLLKPYDFHVAIPFLLNAHGAAIAAITALAMLGNGTLTIGTERFVFFMYLVVAFCGAAAWSRVIAISMSIFLWCCAEASLAILPQLIAVNGNVESLLPRNVFTTLYDRNFEYHALLQSIPKRNRQYSRRYDLRNRAAYTNNWPMNWDQLDEEFRFTHNSIGIRGAELTPQDYSRDMIFVYGGSTTYDVTVTQGATWVERLQAELRERFTVLNFGVPSHSTAEHLVSTAFYQDAGGKRPVCAVYYVGWNDIHNAHIGNLDRGYADWHLLVTLGVGARRPELWAARYSPSIRLADRLMRGRFDTAPEVPFVDPTPVGEIPDPRLESIFADNVNTIVSINRGRGIKTVFIGQILNRSYLAALPDTPNVWAPRIKNGNVWATQERFNNLLERTAVANGAGYIDAGVNHFEVDDFADQGHFSAPGAKKFAHLVVEEVEAACLPALHPAG